MTPRIECSQRGADQCGTELGCISCIAGDVDVSIDVAGEVVL